MLVTGVNLKVVLLTSQFTAQKGLPSLSAENKVTRINGF